MNWFKTFAITVFVGTVGFIAYHLIKDSHLHYYATTNAEISSIVSKLRLSGFIYPSQEIEVKPQLSGVVDSVYVQIGDMVKTGTPIASISLVPSSSEIGQLRNNVNVSLINLNAAKLNYDRKKQLFTEKAISAVEFEAAEKEYNTAQENYKSTVYQLGLRQKSKNGSNNIVRSSTDGYIIDIPVKTGTSVMERSGYNPGTTIAVLASSDVYYFRANVPEKNIRKIHLGDSVKISLLAYDSLSIYAKIRKISAKGGVNAGAVKFPIEAEFSLNDSSVELRSGYSATAEIPMSSVSNVLTLPENYIYFKGDTSYVFVTDSLKKTVEERIVNLGISDGKKVEIRSGISNKDLIVTNMYD